MDIQVSISLSRDDILNGALGYQIICETRESSVWDTRRCKNLWMSEFDSREREETEAIFKQCHSWYLKKGVPLEGITVSVDRLKLWYKIEEFCKKI